MSTPLVDSLRRHELAVFFVLAYAIAWAFWPFGSFGAFAPLIAALIVVPLTRGRAGMRELVSRVLRWRVRWYWYVIALGVPLAVHVATAGTHMAAGEPAPSLTSASVTAVLLAFAVRLVNPTDGPLGEEPGWRGYGLPVLQGQGRSPLAATTVMAVLIAGWHLPLFFMETGGLQTRTVVTGLVTTVAVTYWYSWLFNRTGGSVLLVLLAHNLEGSLQAEGWIYMIMWCLLAIGLLVLDRNSWRPPAAVTTPPVASPPGQPADLGHAADR
jgi:hypothetical protein